MKTIELSAALASAPVQENLKNFAGLDAQNALGLMTPERLAAVAGGLYYTKKVVGDVTDITLPHGIYKIHSEISNLIGVPPGVSYGALIRIVVDKFYFNIAIDIYQNKIYLSCYTKDNWNPWREL